MKAINEMKFEFLSRSSNESFARVTVATFVSQLDPTVDEIADIKTAVSEAVTNAIVHAYKDDLGTIFIKVKIFADNRVNIYIRDRGCGIENIQKAMEPMYTTVQGGERSGLGFTVMQSFMDKVKVRSRVGVGTVITLDKRILSRQSTGGR